jgi:hypothetical protein
MPPATHPIPTARAAAMYRMKLPLGAASVASWAKSAAVETSSPMELKIFLLMLFSFTCM